MGCTSPRAAQGASSSSTMKKVFGYWRLATDESYFNDVLHGLPRLGGDWREHCGQLVHGVTQNWSDDRDDPRVLAERFREQGLRDEDAFLRQAAIHYLNMKLATESNTCKGWLRYDKDYRESGRRFRRGASARGIRVAVARRSLRRHRKTCRDDERADQRPQSACVATSAMLVRHFRAACTFLRT